MANGSTKHGDAVADSVRDDFAVLRHHRERVVSDLPDADDGEEDSSLVEAAVGAGVRAALESHHDGRATSSPPGAPWWVRWLPARFRGVAALVAATAALLALLQALSALRDVAAPVQPEQHRAAP